MPSMTMIVGPTGTGKSNLVQEYVNKGYERLNRDLVGGQVANLLPALQSFLSSGKSVVLDNTHLTVADRKVFIEVATRSGATAECIYLDTSKEDAQVNIVSRLISLGYNPMDLDAILASKHPNVFPSAAHFRHFKEFEIPTVSEGFVSVRKVKFERFPQSAEYTGKALILDYDGTLRKTKSGDKYPTSITDIEALPQRAEVLQQYAKDGWLLLGASNQSGVAKNKPSRQMAIDCFKKTNELLGVDIEFEFCPHAAGAINCWCRKPMPGIGIYFVEKYKLDKKKTYMIGDMTSDKTFASRVGIEYKDADEFFMRV
jgi:HAD superfamily hydrolase (TIGR01662 family)